MDMDVVLCGSVSCINLFFGDGGDCFDRYICKKAFTSEDTLIIILVQHTLSLGVTHCPANGNICGNYKYCMYNT